MEDLFYYIPFLAIRERRKDLLPEPPFNPEEPVISHLRCILFHNCPLQPTHPKSFFLEANLLAFSPSNVLKERWASYYAKLSIPAFQRGHASKYYPPRRELPLPEFLSTRRIFPELKLYHLEVDGGRVFLGERAPLYQASLLFSDILRWLEEKVVPKARDGSLDYLSSLARKALEPPIRRKKGYPYIQKILAASGIEDGRKRILYFWLIPYWVSVESLTPEEVLNRAEEWLSRQGGSRIPSSWILSEADNVSRKGIKPWSISKVEKIDKWIVDELRRLGIL